jgi:hypothetical protein
MAQNKLSTIMMSFHPRAVCLTDGCGRKWDYGQSTRDNAKYHARQAAHEVEVIVETVATYTGVKATDGGE